MRKRYIAIIMLLCTAFLAGCQETANSRFARNGEEETPSSIADSNVESLETILESTPEDTSVPRLNDDQVSQDVQKDEGTITQELVMTEVDSERTEEPKPSSSELLESDGLYDDYAQESSGETDNTINSIELKEEKTIDGYAFVDGNEVPVRIKMGIENVLKGEEAYNKLCEQNADTQLPGENEEYIIVTFNITYDEGETDELFMMENRASLEEARLYFSLSNNESNAYDVTSYLVNNIYNVSLLKGQSAQGAVAFLQEIGNVKPLYFIGFENIVEFSVNYS